MASAAYSSAMERARAQYEGAAFDSAAASFGEAGEAAPSPDQTVYARCGRVLALAHGGRISDAKQGLEKIKEGLASSDVGAKHGASTIPVLRATAHVHYCEDAFAKSSSAFEQLAASEASAQEPMETRASTFSHLAFSLAERSLHEKSREAAVKARECAAAGSSAPFQDGARAGTDASIARIEADLAFSRALSSAREFDEARTVANQALSEAKSAQLRRLEGIAYEVLGDVELEAGEFDKAEAHFARRGVVARLVGDMRGQSRACRLAGDALVAFGDFAGAEKKYRAYLEGEKGLGNTAAIVRALLAVGRVLSGQNRHAEAMKMHEEALESARNAQLRALEGRALSCIGDTAAAKGEHADAQRAYVDQLAIVQELGDGDGVCAAHRALAECFITMGKNADAKREYENMVEAARKHGIVAAEGRALSGLAGCLGLAGQFAEAKTLYEQHVGIATKVGDREGEGSARFMIGCCTMELGDVLRGLEHVVESIVIAEELGNTRDANVRRQVVQRIKDQLKQT